MTSMTLSIGYIRTNEGMVVTAEVVSKLEMFSKGNKTLLNNKRKYKRLVILIILLLIQSFRS